MPHLWINNTVVVTVGELVPEYYKTDIVLSAKANRDEKRGYGIKRVQKGGNGRQMLIDYDTLPMHIRKRLVDPRKKDHPMDNFYRTDASAVEYYTNYTFDDGSYIADNIQERYITNASVLKAAIKLKQARTEERLRTPGSSLKGLMKTICEDVESYNHFLKLKHGVEHNLPANTVRFNEKFNTFAKQGYGCLVSRAHGNNNRRKVDGEMENLLNSMFAHQQDKPTATEISRQYEAFLNGYVEVINNATGELYNPGDFKRVSQGSIYNYLNKWENKIGTYSLRSGDRQKLMQQFKTPHSLIQPTYSGNLISIDDRQPPFEYEKGKRMWFYNAIDLASECYICSVYGKSKEGIIIEFYRQLVRNVVQWGIDMPWELECESSLNSSFKDTFLRPGAMFQEVRIEANNARGKRIEQYFRQIRYTVEKKYPGFISRPFAIMESNQAGPSKREYVPYSKLVGQGLESLETWNNMPHSKSPDMSRWEYFINRQDANLKPINWLGFMRHIGHYTQSSCRAGVVAMNRGRWLIGDQNGIATGEKLLRLMGRVEGQNLDIYWLDGNDGQVLKAMVYRNGEHICELHPQPAYNKARHEQTDADMLARELMSSYVMTVEGFRRQRRSEIDKVTVIDNRQLTVNNNFRMPGLGRPAVVEYNQQTADGEDVEILLPPPADLWLEEKSFKTDLKDRW